MSQGLYYFVADVHLGLMYKDTASREKQFASWLGALPPETKELYLLGDIFDFWYEYKDVIPNGFTRTLGALAALVDRGVKVHFFNGNHDIWTYRYFQKELGFVMERQPAVVEIEGKRFCLGHGDGLWGKDLGYKLLQRIFKCRFLQVLFSALHPRWAFLLGHNWSRHNRLTRDDFKSQETDNQHVTAATAAWREKVLNEARAWASDFRPAAGSASGVAGGAVDYFIFGHQHIVADVPVTGGSPSSSSSSSAPNIPRLFFLGDWIHNPCYVVFDGASCTLHNA